MTTPTPGGARLRILREQLGKTQLWVETEADLGTGYLQRVESGRVAQPGRATLERILAALSVRYSERREVLERFGYTVTTPLPTPEEIAWARDLCQREIHAVDFPAYVLDCSNRLIAWNRYFPALLGILPDDPLLHRWGRHAFLADWFDPASPLASLVADPATFLPALIRAFRYEMRHVTNEPWYAEMIASLQRLPRFQAAWTAVDQEQPPASAARSLVPLCLTIPDAGPLRFRLSSEPFLRDARFRIISYFPADPITMQQCATWAVSTHQPH